MYERHRERGRVIGRGRSRLLTGSLMQDSIPGSRIMPWAKGRCSTTEPPRCPANPLLKELPGLGNAAWRTDSSWEQRPVPEVLQVPQAKFSDSQSDLEKFYFQDWAVVWEGGKLRAGGERNLHSSGIRCESDSLLGISHPPAPRTPGQKPGYHRWPLLLLSPTQQVLLILSSKMDRHFAP